MQNKNRPQGRTNGPKLRAFADDYKINRDQITAGLLFFLFFLINMFISLVSVGNPAEHI